MADKYGRPDNAPDKNDPLLLAARYNDAEAEEGGFEATCEKFGLNPKTVMYLAEQRALRHAMVVTGQGGQLKEMHRTGRATPFRPSQAQQQIMDLVLPAYVDAIVIGWRARELTD